MRMQVTDNEQDQTGKITIKADPGELDKLLVLAHELAERDDITVEGPIHVPPPPPPVEI